MVRSEKSSDRPQAWFVWPALAGLAVVLPLLIFGYPRAGHDFDFHLKSWIEVASQWRHGTVFPRWAVLANHGYGEPRFIFYPPLSWLLGGALALVLPVKLVPGVFMWLALTLAGFTMFLFAERWLPARAALLAALVYETNPYSIMQVYWRWSAGELLLSGLFPLLLLYILEVGEGRRALPGLGLAFAALWLTNAPGAVIASYSAALLLVVTALRQRSPRSLWMGGAGLALGLALAAFYIVPAGWEQRWVQIERALAPDLVPSYNFVMLHPPRNGRALGVAAAIAALTLAVVAWAALRRRRLPRVWAALATLGVVAAFMMFRASNLLWAHLPKLRFVQLPWRWQFVETAVAAFLLAALWRTLRPRPRAVMIAFVVALFGVMLGVARITHGQPHKADDLAARIAGEDGYVGAPEYLPRGADFALKTGRVEFDSGGQRVPLDVTGWHPAQRVVFPATMPVAGTMSLPLWSYPAWRVAVDGVRVSTAAQDGRLTFPVAAGRHVVEVRFVRTLDRTVGGGISLAALAGLVLLWYTGRATPMQHDRDLTADAINYDIV